MASKHFYKHECRHDNIMIECGKTPGVETSEDCMPICFVKHLRFVRVFKGNKDAVVCKDHFHGSCSHCNLSETREYCFLQYYEVLNGYDLSIDAVDNYLNCIRLPWHRKAGEAERYTSGIEYSIVPLDSIRGSVYIVSAEFGLSSIADDKKRKVEYDKLLNGEDGWVTEFFYVNRFHLSAGERYDFDCGFTGTQ